ncbi:hypothetical protein TNCV_4445461 [Trichonephila clavipes]|nr:hypothetical protein TNCV_4445461 [Trichonephila clavipes]
MTWTTPELAPPSSNYHTNGRTFEVSTDLTCIVPLHGGSLVVLVTLPLVRSNSWDAQLVIPNDPGYARLETNQGIGQVSLHEWKHMLLQDVMDIPLSCHGTTDQY